MDSQEESNKPGSYWVEYTSGILATLLAGASLASMFTEYGPNKINGQGFIYSSSLAFISFYLIRRSKSIQRQREEREGESDITKLLESIRTAAQLELLQERLRN